MAKGETWIVPRLGVSKAEADSLILIHKRIFTTFWEWSDESVAKALLNKRIVSNLAGDILLARLK